MTFKEKIFLLLALYVSQHDFVGGIISHFGIFHYLSVIKPTSFLKIAFLNEKLLSQWKQGWTMERIDPYHKSHKETKKKVIIIGKSLSSHYIMKNRWVIFKSQPTKMTQQIWFMKTLFVRSTWIAIKINTLVT